MELTPGDIHEVRESIREWSKIKAFIAGGALVMSLALGASALYINSQMDNMYERIESIKEGQEAITENQKSIKEAMALIQAQQLVLQSLSTQNEFIMRAIETHQVPEQHPNNTIRVDRLEDDVKDIEHRLRGTEFK